MTSKDFISRLLSLEKNFKTVYGWGAFGWPWTVSALSRVATQYPDFYTSAKMRELSTLTGKGHFAFDCVGMIKGVLWGWDGSDNKTYGGAIYSANNVPDIDANMMMSRCGSSVSTDFTRIEPGEIVWMQGHIGVYIGDGRAVECTPAWDNGVQITAVTNIRPIAGLNVHRWTSHGKLPWVEYGAFATPPKPVPAPAKPSGPHPAEITVGCRVMITGSRYENGTLIPKWVRERSHEISQIDGAKTKALLGADGGIFSWVLLKDLERV